MAVMAEAARSVAEALEAGLVDSEVEWAAGSGEAEQVEAGKRRTHCGGTGK